MTAILVAIWLLSGMLGAFLSFRYGEYTRIPSDVFVAICGPGALAIGLTECICAAEKVRKMEKGGGE